MVSRVMVSGKHALTVRISRESYEILSEIAMERRMTVNELLAKVGEDMAANYVRNTK